jgi:hypothetical protein
MSMYMWYMCERVTVCAYVCADVCTDMCAYACVFWVHALVFICAFMHLAVPHLYLLLMYIFFDKELTPKREHDV